MPAHLPTLHFVPGKLVSVTVPTQPDQQQSTDPYCSTALAPVLVTPAILSLPSVPCLCLLCNWPVCATCSSASGPVPIQAPISQHLARPCADSSCLAPLLVHCLHAPGAPANLTHITSLLLLALPHCTQGLTGCGSGPAAACLPLRHPHPLCTEFPLACHRSGLFSSCPLAFLPSLAHFDSSLTALLCSLETQ